MLVMVLGEHMGECEKPMDVRNGIDSVLCSTSCLSILVETEGFHRSRPILETVTVYMMPFATSPKTKDRKVKNDE